MKVLLLGKKSELLIPSLRNYKLTLHREKISRGQVEMLAPDLIVSFGYRHLLSDEVLSYPNNGALNLHISLLPWNRGSDPNFWSWLENTPKGISIHRMARELDAGPIVAQKELNLSNTSTLMRTYEKLETEIIKLFPGALDRHLAGESAVPQSPARGSFHKSSDLDPFRFLLKAKGWNTVCRTIENYGEENGLWRDVS